MKKLYISLLCVLLAVLLGFGIASFVAPSSGFSETENRKLAERPHFTWSGLLDGSLIDAFEVYYADAFPLREQFLKANRVLNNFYYFSGFEKENSVLIIDGTTGAESGGEALETIAPETDQTEQEQTPVEEEKPKPKIEAPEESSASYAGNVVVVGTRAMEIPTASEQIMTRYAGAVNNLAAALGSDVRTISLVTPNGGEFYSPDSLHTGIHSQKNMIDFTYGQMDESVLKVDAYSAIADHIDEYLYFRTDHHWTQLGAYYAYTEFCKTAGFTAEKLEDFESGTYDHFVGSMYTFTSGYPQSQLLKDNPDTLTYYLPRVECSAKYYPDSKLEGGIPVSVVYTKLENNGNKYLCYIGGDTPICIIETEAEGGTCLVLKESYGNAFVPFLTSHYSKIIVIDPREFNQENKPSLSLAEFAKEQKADDLLVINYPYMINSVSYLNLLNRMVGKDDNWNP